MTCRDGAARTLPIIFSAPMILALLKGRKTQTRRVLKKQDWPEAIVKRFPNQTYDVPCSPGDRLWVREGHREIASGEVKRGYGEVRYGIAYRADQFVRWNRDVCKIHDLTGQPDSGPMQFDPPPWRPSIHMPRWASRLTLIVESVKVERLQEISEADAVREGVYCTRVDDNDDRKPTELFKSLWASLYGAEAWAENPFVAAISFRFVKANIDAIGPEGSAQ